jgi:hypothetical protein
MRGKLTVMLGVWLLACAALVAADFWEDKEFTTWSEREVQKMLTDSPWAQRVNIVMGGLLEEGDSRYTGDGVSFGGGGAGRRGGGGDAGFAGIRRMSVSVVWINALPVRQAMVRGLIGRDGPIPPEGQQFLTEEDPFYTLAVVGLPPAFSVLGNIVDEVRAATTLKPRDKEPIPLVDLGLLRDEDQSIRVMFMFPRTAPITLADRDVEFITKLGSVTEIKKKFRLRDMQVGDRLAL